MQKVAQKTISFRTVDPFLNFKNIPSGITFLNPALDSGQSMLAN